MIEYRAYILIDLLLGFIIYTFLLKAKTIPFSLKIAYFMEISVYRFGFFKIFSLPGKLQI